MRKIKEFLRPWFTQGTAIGILLLILAFQPTHPDAKLIPLVEDITPEVMALADGAGSALGTGGMSTKLRAARMVTSSGADMVIANGAHPELLYDIAEGRAAGTRFAAHRQEA